MAKISVVCSFLYGEYYAMRLFFTIETCKGVGNCKWVLSGWHPLAIGALFALVYLPLSPLASLVGAWPGYVVAAILFGIAKWGEGLKPGRR